MGSFPKERVHFPVRSRTLGWIYKIIPEELVSLQKGMCCFRLFSIKAIYLEPTPDLTTDKFLADFARFVSRKGCPRQFQSDNGKTFVGASTVLSGIILYIHPNVRERTGKMHSLFRKTSHHLSLQSLFVDNADLAGVNHCLHQVLCSRNPVSKPGETHH